MNEVKRLGYPLLIIVLSAFLTRVLTLCFQGSFVDIILDIIIVSALFFFGASLHKTTKKRKESVVKKVIAILLVIFLLLIQLGYLTLPVLASFEKLIGSHTFYMNMVYIYCGYLFVD